MRPLAEEPFELYEDPEQGSAGPRTFQCPYGTHAGGSAEDYSRAREAGDENSAEEGALDAEERLQPSQPAALTPHMGPEDGDPGHHPALNVDQGCATAPPLQDLASVQTAAYEASIDSTCRDTDDCNCYWCRKARLHALGVRLTLRERAEEHGLDEDHYGGWIGLATVLRGMGEISDDEWEEISRDWLSGSENNSDAGCDSASNGYRTVEDTVAGALAPGTGNGIVQTACLTSLQL